MVELAVAVAIVVVVVAVVGRVVVAVVVAVVELVHHPCPCSRNANGGMRRVSARTVSNDGPERHWGHWK